MRKPEPARFCTKCRRKHGRYTAIRKSHRRTLVAAAPKTGTRKMPERLWRPGWSRTRYPVIEVDAK